VPGYTPADNTEPNHANILTKGSRHLNAVKVLLQPAFKLAIAQFQLLTFDWEQTGSAAQAAREVHGSPRFATLPRSRHAISRKESKIATRILGGFIFRRGRCQLRKILTMAEAGNNILHGTPLGLDQFRGRILRCGQENVSGANAQWISELRLMAFETLFCFLV
jgi:hypothetical protein